MGTLHHRTDMAYPSTLLDYYTISCTCPQLVATKRARIHLDPSPWLSLRQLRLEQPVVTILAPVNDIYPVGVDVEENEEVVA